MSDILLTYGWVRSSYGALRNLSDHGLDVSISDSSIIGMSQFSKYSKSFDKYVSHYEDEEIFVQNILDICDKRGVSLIFPSHNETEILARHKDRFPKNLTKILPDADLCELFNNKAKAYDLCSTLGIPVPKRIQYSDPNTIVEILSKSGIQKSVIKLLTGNSSKGVFYAENPNDAQNLVMQLIEVHGLVPNRYPQIEEYIDGDGFGCSVLYSEGRFIAHFTHKRLRDKIATGGTSTFRVSAEHKGIEDATKKIFDHVGWNGLAMCEFKVCQRTGKFWFIEINPRMWGSISLAIQAGVEFPYLAWLSSKNGVEAALEYHQASKLKFGWKARWLLGDLFVVLDKIVRLKFREGWSVIRRERADSIDDFFWDDPFVFIGEALAYLIRVLSKRNINPADKGMIR